MIFSSLKNFTFTAILCISFIAPLDLFSEALELIPENLCADFAKNTTIPSEVSV